MMDVKRAAQVIRDEVTMDQVLDLYGYKVRHGFMCCPFHGERQPSLKVYPGSGGWKCFGCGKGGSVIDFVMEQEGCNFRTAVLALDDSLHLGLMETRGNPNKENRRISLQRAIDNYVNALIRWADFQIWKIDREMEKNWWRYQALEDRRLKGELDTMTSADWMFLASFQHDEQYNQYRIERFERFMEEVKAWRRKTRRI